jgi:hypothetical protein
MMDQLPRYRPKARIYLYAGGGRSGGGCPFTRGTFWDLEAEGIVPKPGMKLQFYADDGNHKGEPDCLLFTGTIDCDQITGEWYAMIDDGSFCHESDLAAVPPSRFSPKGSSTD